MTFFAEINFFCDIFFQIIWHKKNNIQKMIFFQRLTPMMSANDAHIRQGDLAICFQPKF